MSESPELPIESDFDSVGSDLDAQTAWKNFGGLTIAEAYDHFNAHPGLSAEDFMWMGPRAFAFYFPVVEQYISNGDGRQIDKIGLALQFQFFSDETSDIDHLRTRAIAMAEAVSLRSGPFDEHWSQLLELGSQ